MTIEEITDADDVLGYETKNYQALLKFKRELDHTTSNLVEANKQEAKLLKDCHELKLAVSQLRERFLVKCEINKQLQKTVNRYSREREEFIKIQTIAEEKERRAKLLIEDLRKQVIELRVEKESLTKVLYPAPSQSAQPTQQRKGKRMDTQHDSDDLNLHDTGFESWKREHGVLASFQSNLFGK